MGAESRNELNKNSRLSGYAELDSMPIRTNSTDQEEIKVNSKDLEDIMGELGEMPKGVQKGDIIRYKNRSGTGQRKFSIDEISSIKE